MGLKNETYWPYVLFFTVYTMPRKYKLNLLQVKVPRHIRSIRERHIEQYDSDSGSGETLDSSSYTSDSEYDEEDSEYEEESEDSEYSEDSEEESEDEESYIRPRRYTYKPNGVKLPRRFHSTMRY